MRIVQFSDTHITHRGGRGHDNTERLVQYLNEVDQPDLVVNTGDIVILDPDATDDRDAAIAIHERIAAPHHVIPGNHDVGECAVEPWKGLGITSERVSAFRSAWGSDHFLTFGDAAHDAERWAFVGINSELCGSGLPEEVEQANWLNDVVDEVRSMSVMLFLHKPLVVEDRARENVTVSESACTAILEAFRDVDLRVVANGHVHRYRHVTNGSRLSVWAPSLSFSPPPEPTMNFEAGSAGVVEYTINGEHVEARFVEVPGVEGISDFFALPELQESMEALDRRLSATSA